MFSTTLRTITVADEQTCKDVAKLAVPGKVACLKTRENVLMKMQGL
jgi:hypothetical protein